MLACSCCNTCCLGLRNLTCLSDCTNFKTLLQCLNGIATTYPSSPLEPVIPSTLVQDHPLTILASMCLLHFRIRTKRLPFCSTLSWSKLTMYHCCSIRCPTLLDPLFAFTPSGVGMKCSTCLPAIFTFLANMLIRCMFVASA